jgi:protocatechuate 3,4-dioxygenase beta subunit
MICFNNSINKLNNIFIFSIILLVSGCNAQSEKTGNIRVGGPFENAEYVYIDMPSNMSSIDTSPGWTQEGQKIRIAGIIYKNDGKTPSKDVVLYYYHTDIEGKYSSKPGWNSDARRHGYIRGWVKSDSEGRYEIYTVRPGSYPNTQMTAHIHITVKEKGPLSEYYIDEIVFEDDPFLDEEEKNKLTNRGGSGIVNLNKKGNLYLGNRDIILGLNIPDYPK